MVTTTIEVGLWLAIIAGMGVQQLGGFGKEYYLAYVLWANFVGRVTTNWMYEFQMLDEIDTGRVNSILVRPISFYEFYLSQFLGYKSLIALVSLAFPAMACWYFQAPFILERVPLMLALVFFYLIFVHTLSFCVASLAFFMNRATSITGLKNLAIWVLSGELIALDLYPEPLRSILLNSPFAAGVYLPVGYITGRFGPELIWNGFISVAIGLAVMGTVAAMLWRLGVRNYTGTGA